MRNLIPFVVAFGLAISLPTSSARACSCAPPPPPLVALDQALAVFSGKVTRISANRSLVWLEVHRAWKGVKEPEMLVSTASHEAACGFPFRIGEHYLVYATGQNGPMLRTGLCSRTKRLAEAAADLAELGRGEQPE